MEDEQFIREVNEEMRQDRMSNLWKQYKWVIIGAAVLIVVVTAASRGWQTYTENQSAASGDKFMAAIALSNDGKHDEAIKNLEDEINDLQRPPRNPLATDQVCPCRYPDPNRVYRVLALCRTPE